MLRLKRNKNEISFSLVRGSLLDKALFFALIYSLTIHLVLLLVFRIKMLQVEEEKAQAPVAVAIDQEIQNPDVSSTYVEELSTYSPLITDSIDDELWQGFHEKNAKYFTD